MASQQRYGNAQPRLLVPNRGGLMSHPAQQLTVSRPEDGPQRGTEACIGARRLRPPEGALLPHGVQLRSFGSTGQGVGRLGSVRRAVGGALRSRRGSRGHARFSSSPSYRWEKRGKGEPRDLPSSGAANEEQGWEWDPGSRRGRREGHAEGGAAVSLLREGERIRLEETGTCQVVLDRTKR